jgi:hypothetical protein
MLTSKTSGAIIHFEKVSHKIYTTHMNVTESVDGQENGLHFF